MGIKQLEPHTMVGRGSLHQVLLDSIELNRHCNLFGEHIKLRWVFKMFLDGTELG